MNEICYSSTEFIGKFINDDNGPRIELRINPFLENIKLDKEKTDSFVRAILDQVGNVHQSVMLEHYNKEK